MAAKKDVEILGAKAEVVEADQDTVRGPKIGDEAPLWGVLKDLGTSYGFENERMYVRFSKPTDEAELDRQEAEWLIKQVALHSSALPKVTRDASDKAGAKVDCGARFDTRRGKMIVRFPKKTSKWSMDKLQSRKAVFEMRGELVGLPKFAPA